MDYEGFARVVYIKFSAFTRSAVSKIKVVLCGGEEIEKKIEEED